MRFLFVVLASYLSPSFAHAVPLEVRHGDLGPGEVFLGVIFDGTPLTIKFDTGANGTQLISAAWNRNYPSLRQVQRGGASGVRYTCDSISFAEVRVDGLIRERYEGDRCDLAKGEQLFALDFFAGHVLSLNFTREAILLDEQGAIAEFPLRTYSEGHRAIAVKIDGHSIFGVFDTGASLTSVDQRYVDQNPQAFELIKDINDGSDAGGHKVVMKLYRLRSLEIAGVHFDGENVLAFDFGPGLRGYFGDDVPLILGFNVLTMHDWVLDLKNERWGLVSPK